MADRSGFVRALRALARSQGIAQVRANAGKDKVKAIPVPVLLTTGTV